MRPSTLGKDIPAGLTLWGLLVPEAIAYAGMAGAPAQAGLYTLLASLPIYALLGTSRQLVCASTSASSIMMAAVLAQATGNDPALFAGTMAALVLLVGALFLLAGFCRLGFVASFLSYPVMTGYVCGLAVFIAASQAPKLLGLHKAPGDVFMQLWGLVERLPQTRPEAAAVGLGALVLLFALERLAPRVPGALVVLVLGVLAGTWLNRDGHAALALAGVIPTGLPQLVVPRLSLATLTDLLPGAAGIALVAFSQALGTAKTFADKYGYEVDPNRELLAMGAANAACGIMGGLANGGSMSSTAVNERAGARSQAAGITAAVMVVLTLFFLTPLFRDLPEPVLGAVVLHAVARMLKAREVWGFLRQSRMEFALAAAAFLGVLAFGLLTGLLVTLKLCAALLLFNATRLNVSRLGVSPCAPETFLSLERHPEARAVPGLALLRPESTVFFANAERLRAAVREALADKPRAVILDLKVNPTLDITTCRTLRKILAEVRETGAALLLTDISDTALENLDRSGLLKELGEHRLHGHVAEAVKGAGKEG
ncbi:SulP family inorganic anion transporter [Desulfovibrio aminophilus]|uniref:SulP family inorganic anion transporter n=1 Tax=Desulfovibrio aminophilus TaxID=81425 RepID=UPI0004160473|nr:SulP family inorganic anion transporter [Desulfovibrio aminophilus]